MEQRAWVASEKKKLRLVVSNMSMLNDLQQDLEDVIGNVIKMAKELQPDLLVLQGVVHHNPRRRSGDKWGKWRHSQPHTLTVTETSTHSPPSQHPLSIVDILSRELGLKFIMYGSSDFRGNAILSKCPITQCSNFGVPWEECGWGVVRITVQTEFKESEGETSGKEDKPKEEISRLSYFGGHRGRSHSYGGDTLEAAYTNIGALMGVYCTYMDGVHGQLTLGQVSKILNLIDPSNPTPHVIIGGFRELKDEFTNDIDEMVINNYLEKHHYTRLNLEPSPEGNNSYTWIWVSEKLSELVKFNLESKILPIEKTKNNMGIFVLDLSK
eukprot:TRINITY_DN585_c0_g1_i1.p1 TRINITY_DN585_c0_g1~~TRINITY_DN585_c0_g1_i1.p1  ORF type:complete len:325 (+),score=55.43 TRINITY_DN585_c0_g1_i1:463-1437(+)